MSSCFVNKTDRNNFIGALPNEDVAKYLGVFVNILAQDFCDV